MYEVYITDVQNVGEVVQEINKEKHKIVSTCYIADSSQLLIFYETASKPAFNLFQKKDEYEIDEEA